MTREEILFELARVKRTIRHLQRYKDSIIRRGGEEAFEALMNDALDKMIDLRNQLESLN